jgi:predicted phosphodiesterase
MDMRYGLISDIHSNLVSLNMVLDYLKGEKVDAYVCCGDIVGYGPWPNECIQVVRELACNSSMVIVGNHDWAVLELEDMERFNEHAREAIIWTKGQLTKQNQEYLKELPYELDAKTFSIVHGSPRDPLDEYVLGVEIFQHNLCYFKNNIYFIGHTHIPACFYYPVGNGPEQAEPVSGAVARGTDNQTDKIFSKIDRMAGDFVITLDKSQKYMINIGSVGQPRDHDPRACCGIFDEEAGEVKIKRLSYDIKAVQDQMKACNLPPFLIERLETGV